MPTREEIEARAYEIYLRRGSEDGDPISDWLQAEQELSGQRDDSTPNEAESNGASVPSPAQYSPTRIARVQAK